LRILKVLEESLLNKIRVEGGEKLGVNVVELCIGVHGFGSL